MTNRKTLQETSSNSSLKRITAADETIPNKRPKVSVDPNDTADDAKTIVTPTMRTTDTANIEGTSDTLTAAAANNKETSESFKDSVGDSFFASVSASARSETVDIAETLGLKAGDRIEVQWEIHSEKRNKEMSVEDDSVGKIKAVVNNNKGDEKNDEEGDGITVTLHWWKATLLAHDGKTTDSVAVRSLLYDARPDLGFPEQSKEDVVFMGHGVLITSEDVDSGDWENNPDAIRRMPFRRVHDGDEITFYNDDELEEQLNSVLMGAFNKNQQIWRNIPAAKQAVIAEMIKKKKDQLKEVIKAEAKHKVITSETIKEILAKTF